MSNINSIIKEIEDLGETAKTVSGVKKNIKELFSEVTEEEKQTIMRELSRRRIKYTEKQKSNLVNINFFIASIKCKAKEEISKILKEEKQERKQEKREEKKERQKEKKEEKQEKKEEKAKNKEKLKQEKKEKKQEEEKLKENNPSKIEKLQKRIQKKTQERTSKNTIIKSETIQVKPKVKITPPIITIKVEAKDVKEADTNGIEKKESTPEDPCPKEIKKIQEEGKSRKIRKKKPIKIKKEVATSGIENNIDASIPHTPETQKNPINKILQEVVDRRGILFKIGESVSYINEGKREYHGKITGFSRGEDPMDWCYIYTDKINSTSKKEPILLELFEHTPAEEIEKEKKEPIITEKKDKEEIITEKISTTLNTQEKAQLKKTIKNKTLNETKDTIKTNKNPIISKIIKKIGIAIGIVTITSGLIRAIWTRAQKDAKNKRVYDTEQGLDQKKNDTNTGGVEEGPVIPPPEEQFTIDKLQQSVTQDKIQGTNYKSIMNTVENIENPKTKKQVIELLKAGDIIGLQEFYGMKKTSEYSSNKATGILNPNTLNKIKNPLFGLSGQDIINNNNIPNDVKEIYKEFVIGKIPNDNLAYLILSKKTCKNYLFDKDNTLIDIQSILIGADLGNSNEFMPYEYYKVTGDKKIYVRGEKNRNTPIGLFKVKKIIDLGANYKIDGPKRGINIVPIDPQGNEEERFKYKQWGLAIHPIYQPPTNPQKYENAMASGSIQDNTITHGCPNIENFGIVFDKLTLGSKVYICTE